MPDDLRTDLGDPPAPTVPFDVLTRLLAPLGELRSARPLTGGMFATTYGVELGDGTRAVVKTAPTSSDQLLSHEHRLLRAEAMVYQLAEADPALLMPRLLLADFTHTVLPGDAVVASWAPGVPVEQVPELAARTAVDRERALGAVMGRLHALRGDRFGYLDSEGTLRGDTWTEAFGLMVEALLADARRWGVPVPADETRAALRRHRAATDDVRQPSLVHADLWPGNLFVDPATGALTAVIDPERAFWGDPLFDVVGAEPLRNDWPSPALVAGHADTGDPLPLGTPLGQARLALCRLYLALVMTVEVAPRGYTGDWLPPYQAQVATALRSALDALA